MEIKYAYILLGLVLCLVSIIPFLVYYFSYYKKNNIKKLCTNKTTGRVVKYSKILYNGVSLPIVEYIVDNNKYSIVGPKFKGIVVTSIPNPLGITDNRLTSNLTTREELPEVIKITNVGNSSLDSDKSPLIDLYPINSSVDVYYNPNNPKMSYVQRYVSISKYVYNIILFLGIFLLILGVIIMSGIFIKF